MPRPESVPRSIARASRGRRGRTADPLASLHVHVFSQPQPGTLPKLRFGRRYRFRLRTVDAASNGATVDTAPDIATSDLRYLRYEPVLPPVFAPIGDSDAFPEGETMHRLVTRQQPFPTDRLVPVDALAGPPSERLVLPPRGSVWLAEQHGKLDDALGNADKTRRRRPGG